MVQEEFAKGKAVRREVVFRAFFDSGPSQSYKKKPALPVSHVPIYESTCLPTGILFSVVGLVFIVAFTTLAVLLSWLFYTTKLMKCTHLFVISDFLVILVWGFGGFFRLLSI